DGSWSLRSAACIRAPSSRSPSNPRRPEKELSVLRRPTRRGKLEPFEFERRRDDAGNQRVAVFAVGRRIGGLPLARGDDHLRMLASLDLAAQPNLVRRAKIAFGYRHLDRVAGMPQPHFV